MRTENDPRWAGDAAVSFILRTGVTLAAALVAAGGLLYLMRYGHQQPNYGIFQEEAADLRGVTGIIRRAIGGSSRGIIQLGLLVLIMTPIARVVASLVIFIKERDRLYAVITAVVLIVLLIGLFTPKFL